MESRIPLPTDNIFKFYALFGLLLVIFSFGSVVYLNQSTNNLIFENRVEYQTLLHTPESVRSVEEKARLSVLESKLKIAQTNKKVYIVFLAFTFLGGLLMIFYGFKTWHKIIQPQQDELVRLTIAKLKSDVGKSENT